MSLRPGGRGGGASGVRQQAQQRDGQSFTPLQQSKNGTCALQVRAQVQGSEGTQCRSVSAIVKLPRGTTIISVTGTNVANTVRSVRLLPLSLKITLQ